MERDVIQIKPWKRLLSLPLYLGAVVLKMLNSLRSSHSDRVLVLEPIGLGDIITSEPLIRGLALEGLTVLVAAPPHWKPIIQPQPNVLWLDIWLPWAGHDEKAKYHFRNYLTGRFWKPFFAVRRAAAGGIGIDPRGDIRSVIFLYLAGCKRVLSLSSYLGSNSVIPAWVAETVPFQNIPRWRLNLGFLERLAPVRDPLLIGPPRLPHLARPAPKQRIALIPVAPWRGKWWPPERWDAIASSFGNRGYRVVCLCGPGQLSLANEAIALPLERIECASVGRWAEELNLSTLVISVDSGPMHLTDAMDIPLVALFGQGFIPLWAPSGRKSIWLSHQDDPDFFVCHPVQENIPLGIKFMNRITVEEVLKAARQIMPANSSGA